jgi:hypothetical protein
MTPEAKNLPTSANTFLERMGVSRLVISTPRDASPWPLAQISGDSDRTSAVILDVLGVQLRNALTHRTQGLDTPTEEVLGTLWEGGFAFISVDTEKLSPLMIDAKDLFEADEAGVALRTETINRQLIPGVPITRLDCFPALNKQGKPYRLLARRGADNLDALKSAFRLLTLPSEVQASNSFTLAITQLVENAERPSSITQDELNDWLSRLRIANVKLNADIDSQDTSFDNFLRYEGKLYWCDGNIMDTEAISGEEAESHIDDWQKVLVNFVTD